MMKREKFCRILVMILLFSVVLGGRTPQNTWASESVQIADTESETLQTETQDTGPMEDVKRLQIEDSSIYSGMTKAYKDGYEPKVDNNTASIVLPLIVSEGETAGEVRVTPDLGDTAASPFVYRNYQKTFKETEEIINNSHEKKKVFLVTYDFQLNDDRMNGTYPVVFNVTAKMGKSDITQSFTIYVRITDGKSGGDEGQGEIVVSGQDNSEEETPQSQPKLIIEKCTSAPEKIEAGEEFTLNIDIKNTNKNFYVQNMTIDISWEDKGLTLEEESKTIFVDRLGSGQTMSLPLKFKAGSNMQEGYYNITLTMSYDNPEAVALTSTGTISVNLHQPMKVELESGEFPKSINAGDTVTLAVQALNLGRGTIYNARCSLDVPGLSSGTSAFLGNVEAGSAVSGELKIFAGMKDESVYSSAYGDTYGNIILTYEDEDGNIYTEKLDINTTVNPLTIDTSAGDKKGEGAGIGAQWAAGVIIIGVILLSAVYLYRRKIKNREIS